MQNNLLSEFGNIDIYLFDQLLKGRFDNCEKIIDVGCGNGRNLVYFIKNGYQVFGIDKDAKAIENIKKTALQLAPNYKIENFIVAEIEKLPYDNACFDLVICSAVLHFARNKEHFENMLHSIWRILKPGGYFFARLASDIGIETLVKEIDTTGTYLLPDGSIRFLANEQLLKSYTAKLNGDFYEPLKTTNVNNLRCMTTWCLRKK